MQNVVRVGVFLTDMQNFAAMNRVYEKVFDNPKPVRDFFVWFAVGSELSTHCIAGEDLCGCERAADEDGCGD